MLPTAHLHPCAGRDAALADTLADFARTDWPGAPRVHDAEHAPDDPVSSTERERRKAAQRRRGRKMGEGLGHWFRPS